MVFIKWQYCTCLDHVVKNMWSITCTEVEVMVAIRLNIIVVVMMAMSWDRGKSRGAEKAGAVETGGAWHPQWGCTLHCRCWIWRSFQWTRCTCDELVLWQSHQHV